MLRLERWCPGMQCVVGWNAGGWLTWSACNALHCFVMLVVLNTRVVGGVQRWLG